MYRRNSFIICIVRYLLRLVSPCFYIIVVEAMAVSSIPLLAIVGNISQNDAPAVAPEVAPRKSKTNLGFYANFQAEIRKNALPMTKIDKPTSQKFFFND